MRFRENEFGPGRIPVMTNVYFIPERLKQIDESYFVMLHLGRYEIHSSRQTDDTLCCVLPFDELDARALLYVWEHHISRLEALVRETEAYNEKLDGERMKRFLEQAGEKMKEVLHDAD